MLRCLWIEYANFVIIKILMQKLKQLTGRHTENQKICWACTLGNDKSCISVRLNLTFVHNKQPPRYRKSSPPHLNRDFSTPHRKGISDSLYPPPPPTEVPPSSSVCSASFGLPSSPFLQNARIKGTASVDIRTISAESAISKLYSPLLPLFFFA